MIWLAISAYAFLGLLFILALCRAASRANVTGLQLGRHGSSHRHLDLTEAEADEQAERGA